MPRGQTYKDVHVDRPLSNFSIAYWQDTSVFVSQSFFPVVTVNHASDTYTTYPQGYFNRIHDTRRSEEGLANTIGYKTKDEKYAIDEDALRIFISDKKRANADSQRNLDMEATTVVMDALLLGKEKEFADNFLTAGKWTTDITGVAATPGAGEVLSWKDADADPVQNVLDQIVDFVPRSGGRRPNKGLMTLDVYMTVREHPSILDRVRYAQGNTAPAQVNLAALAALFELDELVIMQTVMNVAVDGVEDPTSGLPPVDNQYLASEIFFMGHVPPNAGLYKPVAGVTFVWNQYIAHGLNAGPAVRRYRPQNGQKGEYVEGELAIDQNFVSPDMGVLFTDLLATA